jgi:arginyl-tRNA synthetase
LIPQILKLDKAYGTNSTGVGKTAIIEYSSPNIAKPFHAGHLRSTIIGNFIKNVKRANGWTTISINYLGDWGRLLSLTIDVGKQYGLLALGFERYGDRQKLKENPIIHLFDVYVQINKDAEEKDENGESPVQNAARAYFTRMEQGDTTALGLWKEFRDLSIIKYKEIYERLNIAFDIYSGESQFSQEQMQEVIQELRDSGLLVPSDGAQVVELGEAIGNAIICKSDGSMLYLSRDIAAAMQRYEEYVFDKMYYVVANQQTHHFNQV